MSKILRLDSNKKSEPAKKQDELVNQTLALIKTLISSLPEVDKHRVARELLKTIGPPESPKAGDVLASVISLMKHQSEFTVSEVKQHVEEAGGATPKEVYNALGYLTRKGRIRRIGYGRYVVDGMEISTSDDFGIEPDRLEDISDDK